MALASAYLSTVGSNTAFHEIILLIIPVACAWIAILVMFTVLTLLFCQWSFIHSRIVFKKPRVPDPELQRFTYDPLEVSYDEALYSDGETCCEPSDEASNGSGGADQRSCGEMSYRPFAESCAESCGVSYVYTGLGESCSRLSNEVNCEAINASELGFNGEIDWRFSSDPSERSRSLSLEFSGEIASGSEGEPSVNTTPNVSDGGGGVAYGSTVRIAGRLSPTDIDDITQRIRLAVPLRKAMQLGMCLLCSQEILPVDQIRILPCHHNYHNLCMLKYLIFYDMSCPRCRKQIPHI